MTSQPHHPAAFSGPRARPEVPGFTVRTLLGFGSHGEVWLADDVVTGEAVALKIGKPPGSDPPCAPRPSVSSAAGDSPAGPPAPADAAAASGVPASWSGLPAPSDTAPFGDGHGPASPGNAAPQGAPGPATGDAAPFGHGPASPGNPPATGAAAPPGVPGAATGDAAPFGHGPAAPGNPPATGAAAPPGVPGAATGDAAPFGHGPASPPANPRGTGAAAPPGGGDASATADADDTLAREIALLSRIDDPHVVRLRRVVRLAGGGRALVLEHAAGGNLGSLVASRGPLDPAEVTTLLVPLAQALERLHARGLAHGDLSPGNVLFAGDGRPLLSDLGVSRLLGATGPEPHGTPGFVDPAVGRGVDPRASDVWSLAALGWFALTGRPPGPPTADRPAAVLAAPALTRLLSEILGADPAERPPAAELAHRAWDAVRPVPIRLLPTSATQTDETWGSRTTRRAAPIGAGPPPAPTSHRRIVRRRDVGPRAGARAPRPLRGHARRATPARPGATRVPAAAAAAALVLTGGAAAAWAVERATGPATPPARIQAATQRTTGAPSDHRDLARAVEDIGRARAAAFAGPSLSPLAAADERGSPAMAADARVVRELAARRWRLAGVRYTVTQLRVVQRDPRTATVTARVTTSAHRRTTAGGDLVRQVGPDGPRQVTLTLVAVPGSGWRVRAVS